MDVEIQNRSPGESTCIEQENRETCVYKRGYRKKIHEKNRSPGEGA